MYDFAYHRPATLTEAAALFAAADDPVYLSGGMTQLATMKQRMASPSDVIDLADVGELKAGIQSGEASLTIAGLTTHAEVAGCAEVARVIPALAALAGKIGDPHVRHRGTLGGSIANNDPAADYPAALLALGATIHTAGRSIAADDFFTGMFETALEEGEIVKAVEFTAPTRAAYAKFDHPASRYAIVGVFVAQTSSGPRVAITGAASCVYRHQGMEAALAGNFAAAALDGIATERDDMNSDLFAAADYRAHLIGVMAARAVEAAAG